MNLIDCSNNLKDVYKINKQCLKELCFVIGRGLKEYYGMIQVDIVKCPGICKMFTFFGKSVVAKAF